MNIEILLSFIAFAILIFCYSFLLKEAQVVQIANQALKDFVDLSSKEFLELVEE